MRTDGLQTMSGIKADLTEAVPRNAEVIDQGRGWVVCREEVERTVDKGPLTDENGEVVKRSSTDDSYSYPVRDTETVTEVETYRLERRKDGRVRKNYHFEESEEEKERRRAAERRDQMLDALEAAMAESGEAPEVLARKLVGDDAGAVETADSGDQPPFSLQMTSPGRWEMPDGETVEGDREKAETVLREVYGREPAEE